MYYSKINKSDLANGPGVRVSLFCSGCEFRCPGCFNSSAWDFKAGQPFTEDTLAELLDSCDHDYISGLSILGGEPLHLKNLETITLVAKKFKERFPDKSLWIWTGNELSTVCRLEILKFTDVLVTGRYIQEQRDISKENLWRGSRNQRVILVPETLRANHIVYMPDIPNNK